MRLVRFQLRLLTPFVSEVNIRVALWNFGYIVEVVLRPDFLMGHVLLLTAVNNDLLCMQALGAFSIVLHIESHAVLPNFASSLSGTYPAQVVNQLKDSRGANNARQASTAKGAAGASLTSTQPHNSESMRAHGVLPYNGPMPVFQPLSAMNGTYLAHGTYRPAASYASTSTSPPVSAKIQELTTPRTENGQTAAKDPEVGAKCTRFLVSDLSTGVEEYDLVALFAKYGRVRGVALNCKARSAKVFIDCTTRPEECEASLDGKELLGSTIGVSTVDQSGPCVETNFGVRLSSGSSGPAVQPLDALDSFDNDLKEEDEGEEPQAEEEEPISALNSEDISKPMSQEVELIDLFDLDDPLLDRDFGEAICKTIPLSCGRSAATASPKPVALHEAQEKVEAVCAELIDLCTV